MSEEVVSDKIAFFKKLNAIQGDITKLPKEGYNPHHKYKYARDEDVLELFRGLFVKHGLVWMVNVEDYTQEGNKTVVILLIDLVDIDTGFTYSVPWVGEANDSQDKGMSKAYTAALKYFLLKQFIVSTGVEAEDSDSTSSPTNTLATVAQKKEIEKLMGEVGIKDVDAALVEREFPKLALLTQQQAAKVIRRLNKTKEQE
jgi:hypothetical protein